MYQVWFQMLALTAGQTVEFNKLAHRTPPALVRVEWSEEFPMGALFYLERLAKE